MLIIFINLLYIILLHLINKNTVYTTLFKLLDI